VNTVPEVTFLLENKKVKVRVNTSLLQAARLAKIRIPNRCGGKASCLMCKVRVPDQNNLVPMADNESRKLGETFIQQGYRLACQARAVADVEVETLEDRLKAAIRKHLEGME
jgi:2Fe-2S ferredoxin